MSGIHAHNRTTMAYTSCISGAVSRYCHIVSISCSYYFYIFYLCIFFEFSQVWVCMCILFLLVLRWWWWWLYTWGHFSTVTWTHSNQVAEQKVSPVSVGPWSTFLTPVLNCFECPARRSLQVAILFVLHINTPLGVQFGMLSPRMTPATIWTSTEPPRSYLFWFINTSNGVKLVGTGRIFVFSCIQLRLSSLSSGILFTYFVFHTVLEESVYKCIYFWICPKDKGLISFTYFSCF